MFGVQLWTDYQPTKLCYPRVSATVEKPVAFVNGVSFVNLELDRDHRIVVGWLVPSHEDLKALIGTDFNVGLINERE